MVVFLIGFSRIITLIYYNQLAEVLFLEYNFLSLGRFRLNAVILLDMLRITFLMSVRLITTAVLLFSLSYMREDKYFIRFHILLISFVLRIYFLILSPNLVTVLLGWDGLGLTSYLLVIYYGNSKAYNSGIVTAITNRLGDAFLLVSIRYLVIYGNWNFYFYFNKEQIFIASFLILTATTKSAQIPFSAWLPAAIAAPTPVSSLVHSSTLVTAGVYLLIRHSEFLTTSRVRNYLVVIGVLTIIMARIRALLERDLKKIVALSTLRQLGIMILGLGLGSFLARFFHLLRHAFFKALLFLGTGSIIHNSKDYQDMRVIGGGFPRLPVTHRSILLARMRLIGVPFISAFFSKEMILETLILKNINFTVYAFIFFGIMLTALYSVRFVIYAFRRVRSGAGLRFKLDEDNFILQRIFILIFPAIMAGFFLGNFLFSRPAIRSSRIENKILVLVMLLGGSLIRVCLNFIFWKLNWHSHLWSFSSLWNLPDIRTRPELIIYNKLSILIPKLFDRGIISNLVRLHSQSQNIWNLINSSIISILKIFNLFFIWALVVSLFYYLCDINHRDKSLLTKKLIKN